MHVDVGIGIGIGRMNGFVVGFGAGLATEVEVVVAGGDAELASEVGD